MKLHLITIIGGRISTLPYMLDHYLALNIDSVLLYAHRNKYDDPIVAEIVYAANVRGITNVQHVFGNWLDTQHRVLSQIESAPTDNWYVIADQDELHNYPDGIKPLIEDCQSQGFDYVRGCFIDRFSADGILHPIDTSRALEDQFPIGAFFTLPVLGGRPTKIVAARGGVKITNGGDHKASTGNGCPTAHQFIQVHHYKWTSGLVEYLHNRSASLTNRNAVRREDHRFAHYYRSNKGVINLADPGFLSAPCRPHYPYWDSIRHICSMLELSLKIGELTRGI